MNEPLGTEALRVAHEASNLATRALAVSEQVSSHLSTINSGIEAMRRENTDQHAANAKANADRDEKIHTRISSIKQTLDDKIASVHEKNLGRWDKYKDKLLGVLIIGAIGLLLDKLGVHISWPG